MATNTVYVFAMKDGKYAYKTECRSCLENSRLIFSFCYFPIFYYKYVFIFERVDFY